jgi:GNAT superfamily N-acetyltransferase
MLHFLGFLLYTGRRRYEHGPMSMPTEIVIRPYVDEDLEPLVERIRELQVSERRLESRMKDTSEIGAWYVDNMLRDARERDGVVLVADLDGTVAGYASVFARVACEDDDEIPYTFALLADLAVSPALRGRGIGRRLIAACEAFARDRGAQWLRITVLAANEDAVRLYRSAGFAPRLIDLEMRLGRG